MYYNPPDNDELVSGLEAALEDLQDITKNIPVGHTKHNARIQ